MATVVLATTAAGKGVLNQALIFPIMKVISTALPGVVILEPRVFTDARGFFLESYNEKTMAEADIRERFVQDNHSFSSRGVLRGLHYQIRPQGKLVRAALGEILDVAVDLRRSSPTFGRWTPHSFRQHKTNVVDSSAASPMVSMFCRKVLTCSIKPAIFMIPRPSARLRGTIPN